MNNLKESGLEIGEIISGADLGFVILNSGFECVFWNSYMESLSDLNASKALGKKATYLFPLIGISFGDALLEKVMGGTSLTFPKTLRKKIESGRRYFSARLSPHKNNSGIICGIVCTLSEVSEESNPEETIYTKTHSLPENSNSLDNIWWMVDAGKHLLSFNDPYRMHMEHTHGISVTAGMSLASRFSDSFIPGWTATYLQALSGKTMHFEFKLESKGITRYYEFEFSPVFIRGEVSALVIFSRNITENRKTIDRSACDNSEKIAARGVNTANEERYKYLVDSSCDAFSVLNADQTVGYISPSASVIFGYTPEEITGRPAFQQAHPDDFHSLNQTLDLARAHPGKVYTQKYRYRHQDGGWRFMESSVKVAFHKSSFLPSYIINTRDISDRMRVEQQLEYKVNELNTFMYKATHDLRAPLSSLLGLVSLAKSTRKADELDTYFSMIDESTRKMDKILIDLVDIIKISRGVPEIAEINLSSLIDEILSLLNNSPGFKGIEITRSIELTRPFYSDPKLLYSVFQNLLDNSAKYKSHGIKNRIHIAATETTTGIQILISDNGIGIPENLQEKVFQMFYRATTSSSGTGLGLYIVKNSIDKLSGTIELSSKEKEGTFVSITLPSSCPLNSLPSSGENYNVTSSRS